MPDDSAALADATDNRRKRRVRKPHTRQNIVLSPDTLLQNQIIERSVKRMCRPCLYTDVIYTCSHADVMYVFSGGCDVYVDRLRRPRSSGDCDVSVIRLCLHGRDYWIELK